MYAKFISRNEIELAPKNFITPDGVLICNFYKSEQLMTQYGYKLFEEEVRPSGNVRSYYEEEPNRIVMRWEVIIPSERDTKQRQIQEAKAELSALDYKTIKRIQGVLPDEEWTTTLTRCEELRAQINALEAEIAVLDAARGE